MTYLLLMKLWNAESESGKGETELKNELVDMPDIAEESAAIPKQHRTLEERAKSFGGKLGPYEGFDWGP